MVVQIGGEYGKQYLAAINEDVSEPCDYCGAYECTLDHLVWHCSFFDGDRKKADAGIAEIDMALVLPAIRRGIAPAMQCKPKCTYWRQVETTFEEMGDCHTKRRMGIERDLENFEVEETDLRQHLYELSRNGTLNARQTVEKIKGPFGKAGKNELPC